MGVSDFLFRWAVLQCPYWWLAVRNLAIRQLIVFMECLKTSCIYLIACYCTHLEGLPTNFGPIHCRGLWSAAYREPGVFARAQVSCTTAGSWRSSSFCAFVFYIAEKHFVGCLLVCHLYPNGKAISLHFNHLQRV